MLTTYTDYDSIRAALGVSTDDLEDATLALAIYDDALTQEHEDVAITLRDTFTTLSANPSPTAQETRFLTACRLFSTYAVAKMLTSALPLFAAKTTTDGKAAVGRFDSPFAGVIKAINEQYATQRTRLVNALAAVGTSSETATARVYMSVASPSSDPVTGE